MPPKNNPRNWNDVQTAIATAAIVTTLGMWNLFASPAKSQALQAAQPTDPPTEPPAATEVPIAAAPTPMPQVKIVFANQAAPQSVTTVPTQQPQTKQTTTKKKKKGGGTVTKTKTS